MGTLRPRVFVSYSRRNEEFVRRLRADLFNSELDCWIDASDIQAGQRLNPAIESAIAGSNLFFAYVTDDFLRSRWCMAEIRYALHSARVTLAPYVDSQETLDAVPSDLLDEVAFGRIAEDNYLRSALEIAGRAWSSLQESQLLVSAHDHILAGPAIFDSGGYSRAESLDGPERRLMSAYFHVGASTLSAVFVDPRSPRGLLFFSPRWAIQFLPQDRLTCVIDKTINSPDLFKAVYNGVLLMTQGDAKTLEEMLAD
jgi:hypothetical protein